VHEKGFFWSCVSGSVFFLICFLLTENGCIHWHSDCDLASGDFALRDQEENKMCRGQSCRSHIAQRSLPDSHLMLRE